MGTPHLGVAVASSILLAACASAAPAVPTPPPPAPAPAAPQASFPPGFEITFIARSQAPGATLRLDPEGRAWLGLRGAFAPLKRSAGETVGDPFKLEGAPDVGTFAVLGDGILLAVVGAELRLVTRRGFQTLGQLPSPAMQLATASAEKAWLFGGAPPLDRHLVLVGKDGDAERFLELPGPVGAVAGTPDRVLVATEGSILQAERSGRTTLLFDSPNPVRALAAAGDGDVFFAVAGGVFYLAAGGTLLHVMREAPSAIHAHGDDLYLAFDGIGVARGSPISSFKALARRGAEP